jgi:hypothetical protein
MLVEPIEPTQPINTEVGWLVGGQRRKDAQLLLLLSRWLMVDGWDCLLDEALGQGRRCWDMLRRIRVGNGGVRKGGFQAVRRSRVRKGKRRYGARWYRSRWVTWAQQPCDLALYLSSQTSVPMPAFV